MYGETVELIIVLATPFVIVGLLWACVWGIRNTKEPLIKIERRTVTRYGSSEEDDES
jgi:hypothetical protein